MGSGAASDLLACAACGAGLPSAAKFCPECGTPAPGPAEREARRSVTLLFTDVVGSTALGERLDPEVYRALMGRYYDVARAAVERHGGTLEKFVGDAVLAVFGMPEVREDDALRAVRAARDLQEGVDALSDQVAADLGVRFAIRSGVNTGSVVTGSARAGGSFATGDAVNTAARLEQAAPAGEILLGASTYALVRDAVEAEAVDPVAARGKAGSVPAYRLVRVLDAVRGRRRHEDAALVGRAPENRALDDALERTVASGRSHLVTVLGPPGIGKSKLVGEFLKRIGERADVAQGRCLAYGQGITYWPLVQALRDALHLVGSESDELTRHALHRVLRESPDRDEVTASLMPLLGRSGTPPSKEQTAWCVRRLLEELAAQRPLVLTIDDLHWAEPTLLDLLERVREEVADLPLLVLCQARPELLEHYPGWGSGTLESMTFGLDPFDAAEVGASLSALLEGEVPDNLVDAVSAWSGGNPLFVEEIVAHMLEAGLLEQDDAGGWQVVGALTRTEIPPTISALLAARLALLPPLERDVLERASVIGLEFTTDGVALLADDSSASDLSSVLASLTRRDLVRRRRSSAGAWAFKHVLVRDAAYDGLSKSVRAELHERFADGLLAGDDADPGGELQQFVAHHLEQAARYRRELGARGPEVGALVDRAIEALVVAGVQARDADRVMDHGAYLRRALRLEPATSVTRRRILAGLVDHYRDVVQMDHLADVLDAFEAELDDADGDLDHVFLRAMRLYRELMTGRPVDPGLVASAAQELVALGRAAGDATSVTRGLGIVYQCWAVLGLWYDADAVSEEIIRIGSPADARDARLGEYLALLFGDGTFRECLQVLHRNDELYGRSEAQLWSELVIEALVAAGDGSSDAGPSIEAARARGEELFAMGIVSEETSPFLIEAFVMSRDLDGAVAYVQRVNDDLRRSGAFGFLSTYALTQALFMLERGDPAGAVVPLVEEGEGHTSPYDAASVARAITCRAVLAVRAGAFTRAVALADEALRVIDGAQETWSQADLRRWLSEVPRASGDHERERRWLLEAQERYHRKGIRSYDAEIDLRLAELDTDGL